MGAIRTIERVLPVMVGAGSGHIIVLSSLADELVSAEAPSYSASKAGLSAYTEGLALAVRGRGVSITNVRFGFVDTKMAKGNKRPFMMSVDRAVDHILKCIEKKPIRYTRPLVMALLVKAVRLVTRFKM
jgi:short-subunit dehydrogenase